MTYVTWTYAEMKGKGFIYKCMPRLQNNGGEKKKWSSRKILSKSVLTAEGLTLVTYCGRRLKKKLRFTLN